jgi:uncharacterized protein YhaN
MKILRLDFIAFGPFSGVSLDLAGGSEGLHLIYGPNEAGKSSALRALGQMFFGIPGQTSDDFVHAYKDLRIGAWIRDGQGAELEFIRRKANAKSLRGPDDALGDRGSGAATVSGRYRPGCLRDHVRHR